ncbi:MAG: lysophospholipid acyltransferase family protein [Alphaproteobacteria bacterium]
MTVFRSLLFNIVSFTWTFALLFLYIPVLLLPRASMLAAIRFWIAGIFWFQRRILILDFEFCGLDNLPDGPCIIASAHQSAWDTIAFYAVIDDPAFVLKRELYRVPMFGPYARRMNMIAIDRSGGAGEARRMIRDVADQLSAGRKVVIFPGGTRSVPDETVPLKSGITALYRRSDVPVVPVSLNSGYFWGRRSFRKKPGCIVAQFQEPILPGLNAQDFDVLLSDRIHAGNRQLLEDATKA